MPIPSLIVFIKSKDMSMLVASVEESQKTLIQVFIAARLVAIATRLEAIAARLEAIATRLEAIVIRLETIAIRLEAFCY